MSTSQHSGQDARAPRVPYITDMEIVCGNCMGEAFYPATTFMLADFTCSGCGGDRNFVESSIIFRAIERYLQKEGERRPS